MDKEGYMEYYTMEYYSAIKKNKIMPLAATCMDPEIIILSAVSQIEKKKYHMVLAFLFLTSFTYYDNL